jgi:hypothetical protein
MTGDEIAGATPQMALNVFSRPLLVPEAKD